MKKLNKLQINSGKTMMNEELVAIRGGYDGGAFITCIYEDLSECNAGYIASCPDVWEAAAICMAVCPGTITTSFHC